MDAYRIGDSMSDVNEIMNRLRCRGQCATAMALRAIEPERLAAVKPLLESIGDEAATVVGIIETEIETARARTSKSSGLVIKTISK